jgi:hypothetical protein
MTPQGFTDARWAEFVGKGKELVQRDNSQAWAWGDLANEYIPAGEVGPATGHALEQWAEEISYEGEVGTLRIRRMVAAAWQVEIRISTVPWSVHQILAGLEDRADIIRSRESWTASEARAFVEARHEAEREDHEARLQIVQALGDMRASVVATITKASKLLATLQAPVPEKGLDGKAVMIEQVEGAYNAVDLFLARLKGTDETTEEALERLLNEER